MHTTLEKATARPLVGFLGRPTRSQEGLAPTGLGAGSGEGDGGSRAVREGWDASGPGAPAKALPDGFRGPRRRVRCPRENAFCLTPATRALSPVAPGPPLAAIALQYPNDMIECNRKLAAGVAALVFVPGALGAPGAAFAAAGARTAGQVLAASKAAMLHVKDFYVSGSLGRSGATMQLHLAMSPHGGGGSIGVPGATLDIIVSGAKKVFIKADAKSWEQLTSGNKGEAQLLANRWIRVPASNVGFADFAKLTVSTQFIPQLLGGAPALTIAGGVHQWQGRPVTQLTDSAGDILDIAATGAPYLLRMVGNGGSAGQMTFSRFGTASLPNAPANAITLPGTN